MNSKPPTSNYEAVDLGLPSGIKWAKMNLGASSETEAGLYFAWGETTGYANAADRNTALGLTGGFDSTSYNAGSAASIINSLTLSDDAAFVNLGSPWRMPTKKEFQELCNTSYVDTEYTTINGVNGVKIMKKNDHSVYVFFCVGGIYQNNSWFNYRNTFEYWSSVMSGAPYGEAAFRLYNSQGTNTLNINAVNRKYGLNIRPVQ